MTSHGIGYDDDALFSDAEVAELYDVQCPWDLDGHPENAYVSALVRDAGSVLDVGCGTGSMLHVARGEGHVGRLAGIDPDPAMLDRARRRDDIEWVLGKAEDIAWENEFDLATMNSNAFQCFITDEELRASLLAIRKALRSDDGRFAFGTRHVQARAWESWNPSNASDITLSDGRVLRMWHEVESVVGDVVTMTETAALPDGTVLRVDRASLRFFDVPTLGKFLTEAGFQVEHQYGDWKRGPVTSESREIVTIARGV
jgi:SAM-dependent methyltransferase